MRIVNVKAIVAAVIFSGLFLFPRISSADSSTRIHAFTDRHQSVSFNDLTFSSGYVWGELKGDEDLEIIPFSVRVGLDINDFAGIHGDSSLQLGIEPFVNTIIAPDRGIEAGINIGLRYMTPMADGVSIFGEISSGPAYFGIDTVEQGDAGFNFLSQFGAGLQVELSRNMAFNTAYRFRHLSNAGFTQPNDGINTNAIIAGLSFSY
ncbi:MAG: acyloxyacyl hydrolase [Chlorobium sp.]|nr:acyloxyacyl hydrolase [Chlorobium sp.]